MTDVNQLITEHLDIWTAAVEKKSSAGRGNSKAVRLYGVAKLRELIFNLAAEGKLIEPDVETAKTKLGEHVELVMGQAPPGAECNKNGDGTVFVKTGEFGDLYPEVVEWTTKPLKLALKGDVLICVVGATIGKLNLAIDCAIGRSVAAIRPNSHLETRFLYYSLMPYTLRLRGGARGSAQGVIGKAELNAVEIRVPSTGEQHRIVAKVDELMALCDALERQAEDSLKAHQTLVETCLATLTNSQTPEELTQNWTRIEAHFDTLFTTEESVARLETTVLELAIRGLLVSQDPSDEPAATWLERSIRTRDKLVKAKTIRKPKAAKDVDGLPKPYPLPESWTWARLPEVGELARGKSKHRPRNDRRLFDGGEYPLVQTGDVARANPFIVESESFYNDFGLQQSRLWPSGTLCITIAANIADTGILSIDACFPDSVVGYIPFEDDVDVTYFDYFIRTAKNDLEHYAPSTAQKNINLEILGEVLVPLPPKKELNRICDRASDLLKLCKVLRQRIREAQSTSVKLADTLTSKIH